MKNYLGIDYGTKHIGLAIADGPLARPLTSLDGLDLAKAVKRVVELIETNEIEQVVIGLPEGELDQAVHLFGDELQKKIQLPIIYHPETLSTQEALDALRANGASHTKLKNDHVYAACLILEDYLESIN